MLNSIPQSTASMCSSILVRLYRVARGLDSILFFNLVLQDGSSVFTGIQIGRITGPLFIAQEIDVVVLQKVLGLKRFHAWCFVVQKGNLSDVQNILRVLKKGNDTLRQDLLPKIIPIPTLSPRLYHPHHPPSNEEDKNTNTFRTFDQFTMTLFIWNLIRSQ